MFTTKIRVLQVSSSDITVARLLLPLITRLQESGYSVAAACSDGRFARELAGQGHVIHTLPMSRSLSPWRNLRALWALYRLLRKQKYHIVHVHTPVAAAVGRLAAWLAGTPVIIYTAHGFYFHEGMSPLTFRLAVYAERFAGKFDHMLFTQSAEDAQIAVVRKIAPANEVVWISNGVDINRFVPATDNRAVREKYGISSAEKVVGFVGRLVREKGILELLEAMRLVSRSAPNLTLLIAGDNKAAGDRDRKTQAIVQKLLDSGDLPYRVVFTGFIDTVEEVMQALDVFVLPSHREGMPRTIIEAMSSGKPVVATDIRGCREEVEHGETGYLVPVNDASALSEAVSRLLADPVAAAEMGARGRRRADLYFDETKVLDTQIERYSRIVQERLPSMAWTVVPRDMKTGSCGSDGISSKGYNTAHTA